jgi:hypothetical protein
MWSAQSSFGTLKKRENVQESRTIMTSSLLPPMIMSCSVAGARAEESSVRLRVRLTHSSWMLSFASVAGIYDDATGPGTTKRADNVCSCAGNEEVVVVVAWGDMKDGGGSRAPSPRAAKPSAEIRFCYRKGPAQSQGEKKSRM